LTTVFLFQIEQEMALVLDKQDVKASFIRRGRKPMCQQFYYMVVKVERNELQAS